MQIKKKDLTQLVMALEESAPFRRVFLAEHKKAVLLGRKLLRTLPDPVDVVPVQDYPFPIFNVDPASRYLAIAATED